MSGILNHLWQSTAFAAAVALAAWLMRRNSPRFRYWLWLAASLKFLLPFSWIVSTAARVPLPAAAPALGTLPVETISAYFAPVPMPASHMAVPGSVDWALWLGLLWLGGALVVAMRWLRQWLWLRRLARSARPISCASRIPVLESDAGIDPGVFGLLHPVLLLPAGLAGTVRPAQLESILLHELRHVSCRDNLTAALHMCVETAFWFYLPVWWIGAKLMDERERDCDQAALAQGGSPGEYARGILQVCQRYVESPLACAAGIAGADLKKRVREIMAWRGSRPLTLRAKLAVTAAAAVAVLVPFGLGIARGQTLNAQTTPSLPAFDAVSVRPFQWNRQPYDRAAHFDPQRFSVEGAWVQGLIEVAYQATDNQIAGIPAAINRERFTITGTTDKPATEAQMRLMLQRVLAERFHLVLDDESRVQPVYDLVAAKGGPKLQLMHSEKECTAYNALSDDELNLPPGSLFSYAGCTITDLVQRLNFPDPTLFQLDPLLPVIDKTGLTGLYRIALWQSAGPREPVPGHPGIRRLTNIEPIQEALQKELGLELVRSRGPYRILTIKHITDPTAN